MVLNQYVNIDISENIKNPLKAGARWLTLVIPALLEAKVVDHLRSGVRDQLANMVKPCVY